MSPPGPISDSHRGLPADCYTPNNELEAPPAGTRRDAT